MENPEGNGETPRDPVDAPEAEDESPEASVEAPTEEAKAGEKSKAAETDEGKPKGLRAKGRRGRKAKEEAKPVPPRELPTSHEIRTAHKDQLVEWCEAYGLETSGRVADLRKRLLEHIETQEGEVAVPDRGAGEVFMYSLNGKAQAKLPLPMAFGAEYRPDLIRRAVEASRANRRQPYGASPGAGLRHSVSWWGKGQGVSRVPRLMNSRRGAQAPGTVGGRRAWPPKAERDWTRKINAKENRLARLSALAATANPDIVRGRGHRFAEGLSLPLVVEDGVEELSSTRDAIRVLKAVGVYDDIVRASDVKVRAGRGKMRGRRYRNRRSLLLVFSGEGEAARAFGNLPGVEVVKPQQLNAEVLAPGGMPGRLTLFSAKALKELEQW